MGSDVSLRFLSAHKVTFGLLKHSFLSVKVIFYTENCQHQDMSWGHVCWCVMFAIVHPKHLSLLRSVNSVIVLEISLVSPENLSFLQPSRPTDSAIYGSRPTSAQSRTQQPPAPDTGNKPPQIPPKYFPPPQYSPYCGVEGTGETTNPT